MPIVEPSRPGAPLSQGDILTDVRFFVTDTCWNGKGGDPAKAPFTLCMVLSRPCVVAQKDTFIVAGVEELKDKLPKSVDSFEKLLSFLTGIRDGRTSPDVFYLGQLPSRKGRYAARFDSLHTLRTPQSPEEMTAFLHKCRIASLNIDFCRDLHVRVFNAFASLGFEDHRWFSTEDLQALVDQGRVDLAALDGDLARANAAQSASVAAGQTILDTAMTNARAKLESFKSKLAPFVDELERRERAPGADMPADAGG